MKRDRKKMNIVRCGDMQDAPVLTYKSFKELREQLIESLAWDDPEDEKDYPLYTFSTQELLSLGDYCIELKWG
tara:strand:- start:351 stop:569 length:219 start_codon:yes stop_codon:yes gene_type:complete